MNKHKAETNKKFDMIDVIVNKGRWIEKIFMAAVIASCIATCFVEVNYDISEYLPASAPSKEGLNLMEQEFGYPGTARVMVGPVSLYEAKIYKDKIGALEGVDMVMWADTTTDIYSAQHFISYDHIEDYYKDEYAVMDVVFVEGDSSKLTDASIDEIKEITGDKGYLMGSAVQNKSLSETLFREISVAMVMGVVMIAVILCLTTTSWFEPVLFLMVMGIAIIINMGTNLVIGRVSFLTFSVAPILQLAIAMDYSVFLLHSFTKQKARGLESEAAMAAAIRSSLSSILASGATTIVGFLVLMLMRFSIGRDLGFALAKGIVISLVTVLFLMPALILRFDKLIEKTAHKSFMPSFHVLGNFVYKIRYMALALVAILVIPMYAAQNMNTFSFGNSALGSSPGTAVYEDEQKINSRFGKSNLILAVVPNDDMVTERELTEAIRDLYYTKSVTSLAGALPEGIPEDILPESLTGMLHTREYSRLLIYIRTSDESEFAFRCADEIQELVKQYYPEGAYVTGVTPSTQDIRQIITADYNYVNLLSILGVALVVAITFRSAMVPVIVLIPIEVAIFFNMAVPYFTGDTMLYIGYIIVSCLQLGATVDYSILMTNNYMDARKEYPEKARAVKHTVSRSALSVFTSGSILTIVGYGLYKISSVKAIGDLGHLIGRGALISVILVIFLLPILLVGADRWIVKTEKGTGNKGKMWWKERKNWMKKHKKIRKVTAAVLIAATIGCGTAGTAYAGPPAIDTDETLYVNLDYYGEKTQTSVVKGCNLNGIRSFTDYGTYHDVTNMSNHARPEVSADGVTWNLPKESRERFYYECQLDNDSVILPWDFDISYRLNGVPVEAEKLAGANGLVEIDVACQANEQAKDYYKNNMLLQVVTVVNMEDVSSIQAPGSQAQTLGTYKAIVFAAVPGESTSFHMEIGTSDFESSGIVMMMIPGTLDQMKEIRDIKEVKDTFSDSADELIDSLNEVLDKLDGMTSGLETAKHGLEQLQTARENLEASRDALYAGGDQTLDELEGLNAVLQELSPDISSTHDTMKAISDQMNELVDVVHEAQDDFSDLGGKLGGLRDDLYDVQGDLRNTGTVTQAKLDKLQKQVDAVDEALTAVRGMLDGVEAGVTNPQEALQQLKDMEPKIEAMIKGLEPYIGQSQAAAMKAEIQDAIAAAASGDLDDLVNLVDQYTQTAEQIQIVTDQLQELLDENSLGALDGSLDSSGRVLSELSQVSVDLENALSQVESINRIKNRDQANIDKMLEDTAAGAQSLANTSNSLLEALRVLQNTLKANRGAMESGTEQTLDGLISVMEQAIESSGTNRMKDANQGMRDSIKQEIDKVEGETNLLNLDTEERMISFTSDRNETPDSIQIILKTQEINKESIADHAADIEPEVEDPGIWHRIGQVFVKIWEWITGIFR